jgi:hypothetical protein
MRRPILTLATRRLMPLMCAAAACGDQPALTSPSPQPTPAALSPAMRQQLTPLFDLRAAEQFFQTMSQADADRVLADMGFHAGQPPAETKHVTIPIRSTDPARQDLLDRMWPRTGSNSRPVPCTTQRSRTQGVQSYPRPSARGSRGDQRGIHERPVSP